MFNLKSMWFTQTINRKALSSEIFLQKLRECETVLVNDFFLVACLEEFIENSRLVSGNCIYAIFWAFLGKKIHSLLIFTRWSSRHFAESTSAFPSRCWRRSSTWKVTMPSGGSSTWSEMPSSTPRSTPNWGMWSWEHRRLRHMNRFVLVLVQHCSLYQLAFSGVATWGMKPKT